MTDTTTDTTKKPEARFAHTRSVGLLKTPIPPRLLAALPAAERKRHADVVKRAEAATAAVREARVEVEAAPARDREAMAEAALTGAKLPEPTVAKTEAAWVEAQQVHEALDIAVRRSADQLLAEALFHVVEVSLMLVGDLTEQVEAVRDAILDLRQTLAELNAAFGEAAWLESVGYRGSSQVQPFTPPRAGVLSRSVSLLAQLGDAVEEDLARRAGHRQDAERQRQVEAEADRRAGVAPKP